jgi:hypothetical protein
VQRAPALGPEALARVERQTEERREVAGHDPRRDRRRAVVDRERDRDAGRAGLQPAIAEQRLAVDRDREQGGQREVLVQAGEALVLRAREAGGERQPEQHRQRHRGQGDDAGRARDEPPDVRVHRVTCTSPASSTTSPP